MLMIVPGCSALHALPPVMQDPGAAELVDDAALRSQLLAGARLAHETGKTTPMATLRAQLSRRSATLRRPLPRPTSWLRDGVALGRTLRQAVVMVGNLHKCGKCSRWHIGVASGFFITTTGLLVTSYHVVDTATSATLVVMRSNGAVAPVLEVVAADVANDLAVLRVAGTDFTALPLAKVPPAGQRVTLMSHPDGRFYTLTNGVVSRVFRRRRHGREVQILQVDAGFAKGSSGAPIVDVRGAVVGVVSATHSVEHGAGEQRRQQMVIGHASTAAAIHGLVVSP